jgi:UDP-4-amino-4,6-dideoxy-N-acetyl-beta-L-altrosamine N-acetyltransferase
MYTDHEISPAEHKAWFERAKTDERVRYWMIICDGDAVGVANLAAINPRDASCDWGFYLAETSVRGKGVGAYVEAWILREVFERMELHKLWGEILSGNEKVVEMHKSFGFSVEGVLRDHVNKRGEFFDVVRIGMLRDEYFAHKPRIEERLARRGHRLS